MFNGADPEIHGYTEWGSRTPEIPSMVTNDHGIFPTIYSVLREAKPNAETGCMYEWEGIKYLVDTLAITHYAQAIGYDKHPDLLCSMAETYIMNKKPTFLAVCFDQLDHTGHHDGHDTPAYYQKLEELDTYVGRIVEAIKKAAFMMTPLSYSQPTTEVSRKDMEEKPCKKWKSPLSLQVRT